MDSEQNSILPDIKQLEAMTPTERFTLLSKTVSRNSPKDVRTLLRYDIEADTDSKKTMLFGEYMNNRYRNFEILAADPRFHTDDTELMSHVVMIAPHSAHVALLYEQGFRLSMEEESGTFWQMSRQKDLAFLKLVEHYQPELFKKNLSTIAIAAPQNKNPDICAYLLENYLDQLDYEKMIEMTVNKNEAASFKVLFDKYDEAYEIDLARWRELSDSREDAILVRQMAANSTTQGFDIFSIEGLMQMAAANDAHDCLEYILEKHSPDQELASKCLKACMEKAYRWDYLTTTVEMLLEHGADPAFADGEILLNAAKGDPGLMALFVESGADLLPYADKLYEEAIDSNNHHMVDYLTSQRLAAEVKAPKDLLERVLNSQTSEKSLLIETLHAVTSVPEFQDDEILLRFLKDNLEASGKPDVICTAAQKVRTPVLDQELLDNILAHPTRPNNWHILENFLERGLDFSDRQQTAGRLLAAAIAGNGRHATGLLMEDLKLDVHVDGEKPLIEALLKADEEVFNQLIDEFKARVTDIDWHYWYQAQPHDTYFEEFEPYLEQEQRKSLKKLWDKNVGTKPHQTLFKELKPYLERERQEARAAFSDTGALAGLPKSDWLKPSQTLGMSPLQAAARLKDFMPLLKDAARKTGLRFSADELLAKDQTGKSAFDRVVGFGYYQAFFDPEYWDKDVKSMQKLFEALPKPFQDEVGQTVLNQARVKHALTGADHKRPRLRSRRRPG
ncbi:MAG: hypothetical protein ACQEQL_01955 [Pseudomonadota bacterium]